MGPYNRGYTESEFLDKFKCALASEHASEPICLQTFQRSRVLKCLTQIQFLASPACNFS